MQFSLKFDIIPFAAPEFHVKKTNSIVVFEGLGLYGWDAV